MNWRQLVPSRKRCNWGVAFGFRGDSDDGFKGSDVAQSFLCFSHISKSVVTWLPDYLA
jgi:hypothetical protein